MVGDLMTQVQHRLHATTPLTVAAGDRVYAIGDIHGRFDLLIELLDRIDADARGFSDDRRTRLVFLGDFIDRGPQTAEVLSALAILADVDGDGVVFIGGNHEAALLAFLDEPAEAADWLEFGGTETLRSFGIQTRRGVFGQRDLRAVRDDLLTALTPFRALFQRLVPFHVSGDVVFSHGGLDPSKPLDTQSEDDFIWGTPEFLTSVPMPGRRVVHGHFDDVSPAIRPGRICVDTGAYYSGILSAVRLDGGDEIISVRGTPGG